MRIKEATFSVGELYLFHESNPSCPSSESLWGIYDKRIDSHIYLESSTRDMHMYRIWHMLPATYRYCRKSTRAEFRDYMYNMGYYKR